MDRARFRRLVQRAVRVLPPEVLAHLDNLEIVVQREPTRSDLALAGVAGGGQLFGLYVGTPLTEREGYQMALPDRIVIFQRPLERSFHAREIPHQVRVTVMHEIAHHVGIDDARLHALGLG